MRSSKYSLQVSAILCALAVAGSSGFAQEEEDEPFLPGLIAEYRQTGNDPIRRLDSVIAAKWTGRPDERLHAEKPYTVTWQGVLLVPDDGSYQLHVHGRGDVRVELNGKALIDQKAARGWMSSTTHSLTFGPVPLRVTFTPGELPAEISLFWSSDKFEREPVAARFLAHDRKEVVSTDFDRGRVLARALRCEACHADVGKQDLEPMPAPALDRLAGNLHREWLVEWLSAEKANPEHNRHEPSIERRMPFLALSKNDAALLADWLLDSDAQDKQEQASQPEKSEKRDPKKPAPSAEAGEQLLLTKGCLACHRVGEFGESGLFGGGDLTAIAAKRPASYFATWLSKPESLNRDHRMPAFELTADERQSLTLALSARGAKSAGETQKSERAGDGKDRHGRAKELARHHRCDQCHRLPEENSVSKLSPPQAIAPLTKASKWQAACSSDSTEKSRGQPRYALGKSDAASLTTYFSNRQHSTAKTAMMISGEQLLIENNCLACHNREPQPAGVLPKKFADKLVAVAKKYEDLAPQIPAMTPPSLNSVGDKLTDQALASAITRAGSAHRLYMLVQMPKFRLSKEQTAKLSNHFIQTDRIPDYDRGAAPPITPQLQEARTLAGKRLVGTDGFSCTSCHQVGSVMPLKAPPAARGPSLSMPQERLRKTWFDRFVRNPSRIVPRMEMPSVQTPVRGVLADKLDDQLAAVWQVLSTKGFEPPLPEPVRTLRFYSSEDNKGKQPLVITDLIEHEGQTLERAALIGLPNRHNLLFDFATNRLLAWSQGDLARQRTKGKNWYWEPAGSPLLLPGYSKSEVALEIEEQVFEGVTLGQWIADPRYTSLSSNRARFVYPLTFGRKGDQDLRSTRDFAAHQIIEFEVDSAGPLTRRYEIERFPTFGKLHWRMLDAKAHGIESARDVVATAEGLKLRVGEKLEIQIAADRPGSFSWLEEGTVVFTPKSLAAGGKMTISATYRSHLPADEYHAPRPPQVPFTQPPVTIAPGFQGERLQLPTDVMPTALAWRPRGHLVIASLKGQVMEFPYSEGQLGKGKQLADGLAAPYGIKALGGSTVDVATKYALVRINGANDDDSQVQFPLATGWGYTSDYHDWCVGLPQDKQGNYYLALPCFQDNRSIAAQTLRGTVLKLIPRSVVNQPAGIYDIEVLSRGHRFPMGIALSAKGEIFVSDNQGNYNPFNELNYIQPGRHFGFVNKGEKAPESHTSPAICIPHPWTRSVNGICFLNTPKVDKIFGPFEGHLVGCEYDTKRLIRMSLQKVEDDYQGCCYPLTVPTPPEEAPLGPLCCEVSPTGELFIGSIRDSGWGAGNNIGEVIRVKFDASQLGHGLAEMRATASGFELDFFKPVEKSLAEDLENYSLSSYRRESTPAYGGNDIDRRTEKISEAKLSQDGKRVTLTLPTLRAGHVYELRLKSLAPEGQQFFPAEAHYTLRQLVK